MATTTAVVAPHPRHRSVPRATVLDREPPNARARPMRPPDKSTLFVGGMPTTIREDDAHLTKAEAIALLPATHSDVNMDLAERVGAAVEQFTVAEHGREARVAKYNETLKRDRAAQWSAEQRRDELEVMYGQQPKDDGDMTLGVPLPRPREAKNPASEVMRMLKEVPACQAYAKTLIQFRLLQLDWTSMGFAAGPRPIGYSDAARLHDSFYWYYNWLYHMLVPIELGAPMPKVQRVAWMPKDEHKGVQEHAYTLLRLHAPYRGMGPVRVDKDGHELFDVYPIVHRPLHKETESAKRLKHQKQ